jgi:hypothetical protein
VSLPAPRTEKRFRLVIKEYEWHIRDGENVTVEGEIRKPVARRLVYADTLEL